MLKRNLLLVLIFVIGLSSCSKDSDPTSPEKQTSNELIVAEITKVIDEQTRTAITNIDTKDFTFRINGESDVIKNLKVGDILVDSASEMAPNGYLRKVTTIEDSNGEIIIKTEQAKLWEAIPQASIRFNSGLLKRSMLKSVEFSDGVKFAEKSELGKPDNTEFEVFAFDFDKEVSGVKLSGYSSLDMEFIFDFDWSFNFGLDLVEIDLFKTAIAIEQTSNIKVESDNGSTLSERVSIAKLYFTPWTFSLGVVPIVLVPQVELFMEVDGSISAELSTWASENYSGEIGLQYSSDDGWEGIGKTEANLDYNPPILKAGANFSAYVGPEVKVLLYGLAGPTMNITGCCELNAVMNSVNNWTVDYNIGARAQAGVEISILGFDLSYDKELFCIKDKLFSLDGEPFGNSVSITAPINNASLLLGNPISIEAEVIGATPSEVVFYIDGSSVYTDATAPYEYSWETSNSSLGTHTIEVKEIINGSEVSSDKIEILLQKANWTAIDLSEFGVEEDVVITQVTFVDENHGWIFIKEVGLHGVYSGYVLITTDGGKTWTKNNNEGPSGYSEAVVLNRDELYGRCGNFVYQSVSGGQGFTSNPIIYCPGDPPIPPDCEPKNTFPFDVEGIALNYKGELVAVGEYDHLAAGTTDFIIRRARTSDNDPTGTYTTDAYYATPGDFAKLIFKNSFGITYNIGIQGTQNPVYLITNDDGETWTEHPATFQSGVGRDTYGFDAFFWDENTGWIVGGTTFFSDGYIAKTTDGGETFNKIKFYDIGVQVDGGTSAGAVWFISPDEGYVGFRHFPNSLSNVAPRIYHTTDGGTTWSPVEEVASDEGINDIFFLGSKLGWAVGNGNIVYKYTAE